MGPHQPGKALGLILVAVQGQGCHSQISAVNSQKSRTGSQHWRWYPGPILSSPGPGFTTLNNHGPQAGSCTPRVVKGAPRKASVPSQFPASGADQRFTALEADGWGSNSLLLTKVKVLHVLTLVGPQS